MTRKRSVVALASVAALSLFALAGISLGAASAATSSGAESATVDLAKNGLGNVLVDSRGRTLYLFKKDSGTKSACTGACARFWPPLRATGKPTTGRGVKAAIIGTTKRSDGKPQVTYKGHPLYLYSGDKKAGDTKGEGLTAFGARWFALSSAGTQVTPKAPSVGGPYG
jgi:predicted lipoprotein with Yx(FWY)xxD motif